MLVSGMFMKLTYLCQMNVLLLKLWNCKMCIGHFYLPSMFDQFVQKVLCILFWKIMNISFHNILHAVSSHSLFMIVIACQINGNLLCLNESSFINKNITSTTKASKHCITGLLSEGDSSRKGLVMKSVTMSQSFRISRHNCISLMAPILFFQAIMYLIFYDFDNLWYYSPWNMIFIFHTKHP